MVSVKNILEQKGTTTQQVTIVPVVEEVSRRGFGAGSGGGGGAGVPLTPPTITPQPITPEVVQTTSTQEPIPRFVPASRIRRGVGVLRDTPPPSPVAQQIQEAKGTAPQPETFVPEVFEQEPQLIAPEGLTEQQQIARTKEQERARQIGETIKEAGRRTIEQLQPDQVLESRQQLISSTNKLLFDIGLTPQQALKPLGDVETQILRIGEFKQTAFEPSFQLAREKLKTVRKQTETEQFISELSSGFAGGFISLPSAVAQLPETAFALATDPVGTIRGAGEAFLLNPPRGAGVLISDILLGKALLKSTKKKPTKKVRVDVGKVTGEVIETIGLGDDVFVTKQQLEIPISFETDVPRKMKFELPGEGVRLEKQVTRFDDVIIESGLKKIELPFVAEVPKTKIKTVVDLELPGSDIIVPGVKTGRFGFEFGTGTQKKSPFTIFKPTGKTPSTPVIDFLSGSRKALKKGVERLPPEARTLLDVQNLAGLDITPRVTEISTKRVTTGILGISVTGTEQKALPSPKQVDPLDLIIESFKSKPSIKVGPRVRPFGGQVLKPFSIQAPRGKRVPGKRIVPKVIPDVIPKVIPDITRRPKERVRPRVKTKRDDVRNIFARVTQRQRRARGVSFLPTFKIRGVERLTKERKVKAPKGKRAFRRTPSLVAQLFDIRAPKGKAKRDELFTGLEIRGLQTPKQRRTKRRGVKRQKGKKR